jgi:hypothetical protein
MRSSLPSVLPPIVPPLSKRPVTSHLPRPHPPVALRGGGQSVCLLPVAPGEIDDPPPPQCWNRPRSHPSSIRSAQEIMRKFGRPSTMRLIVLSLSTTTTPRQSSLTSTTLAAIPTIALLFILLASSMYLEVHTTGKA